MRGLSRSWLEWRILARAVTTMAITVVITRTMPYSRSRRVTQRLARLRHRRSMPAASPRLIVRAVDTASRLVPGGRNCLVRAVTGRALMAREGAESELVVGVAKSCGGAFESHAWLRYNGETILGGAGAGNFAPMPGLGDRI
jgi:hypothetical protein